MTRTTVIGLVGMAVVAAVVGWQQGSSMINPAAARSATVQVAGVQAKAAPVPTLTPAATPTGAPLVSIWRGPTWRPQPSATPLPTTEPLPTIKPTPLPTALPKPTMFPRCPVPCGGQQVQASDNIRCPDYQMVRCPDYETL
jgi:hypothetical protein